MNAAMRIAKEPISVLVSLKSRRYLFMLTPTNPKYKFDALFDNEGAYDNIYKDIVWNFDNSSLPLFVRPTYPKLIGANHMGLGDFFEISTNDIIALVLVYALIVAVLGIAFFVQKRSETADVRKIIHIGIGNFVFIWWMFEHAWVMEVFFAIPFAIVLFLGMLKDNKISNSALGDIANNKGHKQGLFLYVVSIVILVALCFNEHWTAASIGIVAMTWGDGFGSIIGKKYGMHKSFNGKSIEGTLAVFGATAIVSIILVIFLGFMPLPAGTGIVLEAVIPMFACCLIAGAVVAVTETFSPGWIDNLVNCLAVTGVMILLGL